jgi:glycosyltransferase involved in cell wall biosynthesis
VEIHGGGESLPEVKRVAQDEKIEDICVFSAGEYKLYDLPKLIERSAIGIVPYIPDEFINNTISNKVFDYMAAGRPLFASKATTLARIIEETKAGISWDCTTPESVAEGIKHLLKSDLQTMSENGKHWAREKYNWEADESVLCEFVERYCP